MSEAASGSGLDWRAGFQEALLRFVVREGGPIDERGSWYTGNGHPDWLGLGAHLNTPGYIRKGAATEHQRAVVRDWTAGLGEDEGCPLDLGRMSWRDSSWTEFAGTFEEDVRVSGIDAVVWCRCGRVGGITWRWEGGLAELIRGITEV